MKPSIVFSHGIWADGSCLQKLIPALRAEGHQVIAAQYGLDTVKGDVDATIRSFGRVSSPIDFAPAADLFTQKYDGGFAWRSKRCWSIVATQDRTVHPDVERFAAKRMGAKTVEVASSHVP